MKNNILEKSEKFFLGDVFLSSCSLIHCHLQLVQDELADDENPDEDYDEVDGDIPQKPQQVKKSFRGFRGKITG